jgi:RNA polymerase sigma-70 factor, ECF subfamily
MSDLQAPAVSPFIERGSALTPSQLIQLRQRLLRRARYAVHGGDMAEDLVQDTLIAVVQQLPRYRGDASLETWATAILKHKVADWYRSPARRRFVQANVDEESIEPVAQGWPADDNAPQAWVGSMSGPEPAAEQHETMRALDACVAAMPKNSGRALLMHDWQGYESPEVCERLGVSRDNLRTLLYRARKTVRDCIRHDWINCKGRHALHYEPAAEPQDNRAALPGA